jgi:hypothetical protein
MVQRAPQFLGALARVLGVARPLGNLTPPGYRPTRTWQLGLAEERGSMGNWEVVSNSGQQMILERGLVRKELLCPINRIGSRIFRTASPGQLFEDTTIRLLLTDYKV